ncbi:SAM-dependent methyltransferase [Crossiella equi]|uniref:SAM-dependent methyltransferase n=1 Tax=Crossiella equi TaxID=130796 RepID=A0ABS5ALL6_9PSEU|nr:class I SAM-dependent methyltransferase [Crossiella equi]MBP2477464.1 SAM-dependent methyltransferase [Crossiella equi]
MTATPRDAARPPVRAHLNYLAQADRLSGLATSEVFAQIYRSNMWGSDDSVSGDGSALDQTAVLREELPKLLRRFGVRSLLDIPCGDFGWLATCELELDTYLGADIVEELIAANLAKYYRHGGNRRFYTLDLTRDPLPRTDAVLCRDCLVHLSFEQIWQALDNLRRSGSRYLLATTFLELAHNEDISTGDWRPLNLERPPFNLREPVAVLVENCTEGGGAFADKALGVWEIDQLPLRRP